jgi:hypothetical protein
MTETIPSLGDDLLEGAEEIRKFLFGERGDRRRVYYLLSRGLPHFRLGSRIYSRKSALLNRIDQQTHETAGTP